MSEERTEDSVYPVGDSRRGHLGVESLGRKQTQEED
jgi:hypothetical protein